MRRNTTGPDIWIARDIKPAIEKQVVERKYPFKATAIALAPHSPPLRLTTHSKPRKRKVQKEHVLSSLSISAY